MTQFKLKKKVRFVKPNFSVFKQYFLKRAGEVRAASRRCRPLLCDLGKREYFPVLNIVVIWIHAGND